MMDFKNIQIGVDTILNTKTIIRRKKKNAIDKKKELFTTLINLLEDVRVRQALMHMELGLDFTTYDENYFSIIDILMHMNFTNKGSNAIAFYLYDRLNQDGSINPLIINGKDQITLNNPYELWDFLCQINPKLNE